MIAVASWSLVGVAAFASTASAPKRVGVVIANGFEMLDAIGPFEVFKEIENTYFAHVNLTSQTWSDTALQPGIQCSADGGPPLHVEVEWVADSLTPVTSISGVIITPTYALKEDPEAKRYDLLVFGALNSSKYEGARTEYKDGHTQTTKDYLKATAFQTSVGSLPMPILRTAWFNRQKPSPHVLAFRQALTAHSPRPRSGAAATPLRL